MTSQAREEAHFRSRVEPDGSLVVAPRRRIPAEEITLRVTTSGGPGGQHANRAKTRVVATFDVSASLTLSDHERQRLEVELGPVIRSSASRFRSQGQNRTAALEQLARRVASALAPVRARRATRPTAGSKVRRLDDKRVRARRKLERRRPEVD